jgi:hypothetical protein
VESGQLVIVSAAVSVGPVATATAAKGDVGAPEDPWSMFCAGGEIALAATMKDVAASVAQQMKYVSVTSVCNCIVFVVLLWQSLWQAAAFAERIASEALTSEFSAERRWLEGRIERLRTQHTEAVRDKSTIENKSRNLFEKLTTAKMEKEDLSRRLAEEREGAEKTRIEAQAARAEASLALKCAANAESGLKSLCNYFEKMEASTRAGVEWAHALFVDAYRELGTRTTPFDKSSEEVGLRFLGWLQEELESLPSIAAGLMSYASLVTCEGAVNALSREGCRHFEVFDRVTEDFDRGIFQVIDEVLKRSAGALYDRMWGPHDRNTVWKRADRALTQVLFVVSAFFHHHFLESFCCLHRWWMMKKSRTSVALKARWPGQRAWRWGLKGTQRLKPALAKTLQRRLL